MKKTLLILLILIISCIVAYFKFDKKLFYYGKSNFDIYRPLPLKIKPVFKKDYKSEFRLEDEEGFSIASRGVHQYIGSDMEINIEKIIAYTFTNQKLNILIEDVHKKKYFIECSENTDYQSKQEMKIKVLAINDNYDIDVKTWINIDGNSLKKAELIRNYLLLFSCILLSSTIILIFRCAQR